MDVRHRACLLGEAGRSNRVAKTSVFATLPKPRQKRGFSGAELSTFAVAFSVSRKRYDVIYCDNMRNKKHTPKGAGIRAREAQLWLRIAQGGGEIVEMPKPLPVIRF